MTRIANVAIVGGGIMGASIAYHLASRKVEKVVVFEREEILGTGATGKCAGGVRLQFSTLANVEMSRRSIEAFARFDAEMDESIDFRQIGYLFVLTSEAQLEKFRGNAKKQQEMGVSVEVITPEDARNIVSELRTDDLVGATFCHEEGVVNPHAILQGYAKNARRLGARFVPSAEVTGMKAEKGRVVELTAGGERWEVGTVINAAGPWAKRIGQMVGIAIPVEPVRRQYFLTRPISWVPESFPLLIDWGNGVYMHKESGGMLIGESDFCEPSSFNEAVDWDFLAKVSEHAIHRVPKLDTAEVTRGVAGLYEVSPDHNAILGHVPELENFLCANGFSGHGMQHSPAVGFALAELVTEGFSKTVDLEAYTIERFHLGTEVEYNVI